MERALFLGARTQTRGDDYACTAFTTRNRRLGRAAAGTAPTIYVNDNFARWQGGFDDLVTACREAAGPFVALVKWLAPRRHDYHVLKPKHSGFLATPLPILLAKPGVPGWC